MSADSKIKRIRTLVSKASASQGKPVQNAAEPKPRRPEEPSMVAAIDEVLGDIGKLSRPPARSRQAKRKPLNIINRSK